MLLLLAATAYVPFEYMLLKTPFKVTSTNSSTNRVAPRHFPFALAHIAINDTRGRR